MLRADTAYTIDEVSRVHFAIFQKDGKAFLQSNSMNGTFVNGKQLTKGEVAELKSEDRISVLGSELELFWYINEKDMRENSSYPVDIYNTYVIGNIVGKGTFGVVRKGFWKHDGNNSISGYNNNTISGHQGRRSLSSLSTRTS